MAVYLLLICGLCLTQYGVSAQSDSSDIPAFLYKPINDSLTDIKLLLDNVQQRIHNQQSLTIPVLIEMNRSIGDQGPFDAHLAVSPRVYNRFLAFVDTVAEEVSEQVTQLFLRAIRQVGVGLRQRLSQGQTNQAVKFLKFVCFEIAPKIGLVTADNRNRYWTIYEWVAIRLVKLQWRQSPTPEAYSERLEEVLDFGVRNFNRYINDVGNRVDEYSSEVARKLVEIIKDALDPAIEGIQVVPFARDNFEL